MPTDGFVSGALYVDGVRVLVLGEVAFSGQLLLSGATTYAFSGITATSGQVAGVQAGVSGNTIDTAKIEMKWLHRARPHPFDVTSSIVLSGGDTANGEGAITTVVPPATYDFGDTPNVIRISEINVEDMSANDTYCLTLYRASGIAGEMDAIGATRFSRSSPQTRSFQLNNVGRDVDNDAYGIYGSLRTKAGSYAKATVSVDVVRVIRCSGYIPPSTGEFPYG